MNLQEAYELRRQEVLSLQRQNKKLQKELEQVAAGLFTPEEKISLHKQIIKLTRTLANTEKEKDRYRNLWDRERERNLTCEFARMDAEEENRLLKEENRSLKEQLSAFRKEAEQDAAKKIQALCDEVSRLQAILDNDGTNSGTPTSKTPAGKKKVIPNSRVKSNRKTGGQPGHAKAALPMLAEEEVTEYEYHRCLPRLRVASPESF
jgi:deoxyribodipyrimidine photolyase